MRKLLEAGLISKITLEQAKCISNSFFVKKADGTWRWVINLVTLNSLVKSDLSHLFSVNEFVEKLDPNAKVFL